MKKVFKGKPPYINRKKGKMGLLSRGHLLMVLILIILFASLNNIRAQNLIQDEGFEWNNNTWTEAKSAGCVANQSTTAQNYSGNASGETNTTNITASTGSASLSQTINHLVTDFNFTNSLSWWALWQTNSTNGARDCYTKFTSDGVPPKNLFYWYNLNNAVPGNSSSNVYLTITNPTYKIWSQTQRNFWIDWNQTANFSDQLNITAVKAVCDGNYTADACAGTNLPCSTWNGSSSTCTSQYGCSYNTTESTVNIYPSAVGTHTDFSVYPPVPPLANWDAVDETPANDSDYVWSITASQNDTYNLQNLSIPAGSTINNITVFERAIYYDTTHKAFYIIVRTNLADYNGTKKSGLIALNSFNTTWTTNPNTGVAWTISDINNLEVGAQIATVTSQGGINITQVYVTIDYTPNTCYDNPGHYSCDIANYPTSTTCAGNLSCTWTASSTFGQQFFWDVVQLNITDSDVIAPTVLLLSPANGNISRFSSITFNCSASDNINVTNVSLYGNWSTGWHLNATNSSPLNNTGTIFSKTIADGFYSWNCQACDNSSNCSFASSNYTITIDTTAPTITLPAYTNGTKYTNSQSLIVNISVADAGVGASYCRVNIGVKPNSTIAYSGGWCNGTYSLAGIADGNQTINAYANDTLGNTALNNSYVVFIDTTTPTITHNSPTNDSYYNHAPYFNGTCTDAGAGLSGIYTNLTEYNAIDPTSPYNFTNASGLTNRVYAVLISCNDTLNNTATSMFYFTFDVVDPTSTINGPINMTNTTDNMPDIDIILKDNFASAINYTFFINDTGNKTGVLANNTATNITMDALPDGIYRIKVQATDNATNKVNSPEYWYLIDSAAPSYSNRLEQYPTNYNSSASIFNITWTDSSLHSVIIESNFSGSAGNVSMTYLGAGVYGYSRLLGAGTYYWKSYANDSAGNWNSSNTVIFTINRATSTCNLTFNLVSPITYGEQLNASCLCSNTESSATLYRNNTNVTSQNNNLVTLTAGNYNYTCNVSSSQNYTSASNSSSFIINRASPNLKLYLNGSQNNRTYHVPAVINATATKNTSSEGTLEILINRTVVGSTSGSSIENITIYSSEDYVNYSARFNQTDNYSEQLANYFATMQIAPPDNPPEINLVSPENESTTTNNYVNFTCNATDDNQLSNITFYWKYSSWQENGTVNVSGTENQTSFYRENLANTEILWACLAYDNASNYNWSENRTVTIDYSAPKTPGGGGGGGGGGAVCGNSICEAGEQAVCSQDCVSNKQLKFSVDSISLTLAPGESEIMQIGVINNLGKKITAELSAEGRTWEFTQFEKTSLNMENFSIEYIQVKFFTFSTTQLGTYIGYIVVSADNVTTKIPVTIKVENKPGSLLDVDAKISTPKLSPGDILTLKITLLAFGEVKQIDVRVNYTVEKAEIQQTILMEGETLAVDRRLEYTKTMKLPENLETGRYLAWVYAYYDNQTASAIVSFEVVKESFLTAIFNGWVTCLIIFILVIAIILIVYLKKVYLKKRKIK